MYEELRGDLAAWATHFHFNDETSLLLCKAADAIEDLQAQLMFSNDAAKAIAEKVPKWIPVTERLPEVNKDILAIVHWINEGDNTLCFGHRKKNGWFLWNSIEGLAIKNYEVTYWMPLPEPPKDGEQ